MTRTFPVSKLSRKLHFTLSFFFFFFFDLIPTKINSLIALSIQTHVFNFIAGTFWRMNARKVYAVEQKEIEGREDNKAMLSMFTFDFFFFDII